MRIVCIRKAIQHAEGVGTIRRQPVIFSRDVYSYVWNGLTSEWATSEIFGRSPKYHWRSSEPSDLFWVSIRWFQECPKAVTRVTLAIQEVVWELTNKNNVILIFPHYTPWCRSWRSEDSIRWGPEQGKYPSVQQGPLFPQVTVPPWGISGKVRNGTTLSCIVFWECTFLWFYESGGLYYYVFLQYKRVL